MSKSKQNGHHQAPNGRNKFTIAESTIFAEALGRGLNRQQRAIIAEAVARGLYTRCDLALKSIKRLKQASIVTHEDLETLVNI